MSEDDDKFFSEDLLEEDSRPSPQLWGDDNEIPIAATPVNKRAENLPRHSSADTKTAGFKQKTKARELALQMLFQADVNPETPEQDVADQLRERLPQADMFHFAWSLYRGVLSERLALDEAITSHATNWKLSRMAVTDRNVLRLGAFELKHMDTPYGVALDEAIDLAKKFGTNNSASFVNGVLDKLVPESKRPGGSTRPAEAAPKPSPEPTAVEGTISSYTKPEDMPRSPGPSPIKFRRKGEEDS